MKKLLRSKFLTITISVLIGISIYIGIKVVNITVFQKKNLYEYITFNYFDDYDYKYKKNNVINVDSNLAENFKEILNIFLYMENNKYCDTTFKSNNIYNIEEITFDYNNMLSVKTLGNTVAWIDSLGHKKCRIILNLELLYVEDRDIITFILLHEIAHSAYNIKHYDAEPDLMNTAFNIEYFTNNDIKYIIQDFTILLNKYERTNN